MSKIVDNPEVVMIPDEVIEFYAESFLKDGGYNEQTEVPFMYYLEGNYGQLVRKFGGK